MINAPLIVRRRDDPEMPLVDHLIELRRRVIVSLLLLGGAALLVYQWSGAILSWLAHPVGGVVFTAPTDALYMRLKVAIYGGFMLTFPLLLHQAWLFVARALPQGLRRALLRVIPLSYLLFVLGAAIALFAVVPAAMRFLLAYGSSDVRPLLALGSYLEFVTQLSLAFGLVFQLPLVLYFLNRMGLVSKETLASRRRYIYLLLFIAAGLFTPGPDVFSQFSMAAPSILLFELTLLALA